MVARRRDRPSPTTPGSLPGPSSPKAGATVTFDATSHDAFPALDFAIAPERIARSGVRLAGRTYPSRGAAARARSRSSSGRSFPPPESRSRGSSLRPKRLELTPDKVAEYLEDIGRGAEAKSPPQGRWRESYRKLMKTFVVVDDASVDGFRSEPVGLALELVPLANPSALKVGDTLAAAALEGGPAVRRARRGRDPRRSTSPLRNHERRWRGWPSRSTAPAPGSSRPRTSPARRSPGSSGRACSRPSPSACYPAAPHRP